MFVVSAATEMRVELGLVAEAMMGVLVSGEDGSRIGSGGFSNGSSSPEQEFSMSHPHTPVHHQQHQSFNQRRILLSTEIGHLFYLYPTLCSAMEIISSSNASGSVMDEELPSLLRAAFTAMGRACGLFDEDFMH